MLAAAAIFWQMRDVGRTITTDRPDDVPLLGQPHAAAVARRRHRPGDDEQPLHPLRPRRATVASHQLEHAQITPRPGWVEHDADEILERVRTCVRVALRDVGADARRARRGRDQRPARDDRRLGSADRAARSHHAIVWQDTRTAEAGARLARPATAGMDRFRALTGLPISTYSSALKLAWILDDGRRRAAGRRRARRPPVRHHRHVADLAPDRRRPAAAST